MKQACPWQACPLQEMTDASKNIKVFSMWMRLKSSVVSTEKNVFIPASGYWNMKRNVANEFIEEEKQMKGEDKVKRFKLKKEAGGREIWKYKRKKEGKTFIKEGG